MPPMEDYTCRVGDTYKIVYGLYAKGKPYTFTVTATVTGEELPLGGDEPAEKPAFKSKSSLKKAVRR